MASYYKNEEESNAIQSIVRNNYQMSELLMQNAKISKDYYLKNKCDLHKITRKENLINLPATPISKIHDISLYYKWNSTIKNYQLRKNLSCLMQYDDYLTNLRTLFNVYGSVEKIMIFYMQCNIVFVIEALVRTLADEYSQNCIDCPDKKYCKDLINKNLRNGNLYNLIVLLNNKNLLNLNDEKLSTLEKAIKLRNKLHIRDMEVTACLNWDISDKLYRDTKECLNEINLSLIEFNKKTNKCEHKGDLI